MPCHCLSFHADFRCHHSGACCTSGWPIHVETGRLPALRAALNAGRLPFTVDAADNASPFVEPAELPPDTGAVLRTRASGACVFYDGDGRLCAVQRTLGHDHLPSACQHFPRRCLLEPDRTAVTLSHYCPTVARMAFQADVAFEIVPAPDALVGRLAPEGLDGRDALPPLLRPGLLMDRASYHAWERAVVRMLAAPGTPEAALGGVSAFVERLREWTPRDGELREAVDRCRPVPRDREEESIRMADGPRDTAQLAGAYETVRASVPAGIATTPTPDLLDVIDARWVADAWPRFSRPLRHFLAAHAFGNWCAYHGLGLRTVVQSLEAALAVVRVEAGRLSVIAQRPMDEAILLEAMRAADLLLIHLADPRALASRLSAVEHS